MFGLVLAFHFLLHAAYQFPVTAVAVRPVVRSYPGTPLAEALAGEQRSEDGSDSSGASTPWLSESAGVEVVSPPRSPKRWPSRTWFSSSMPGLPITSSASGQENASTAPVASPPLASRSPPGPSALRRSARRTNRRRRRERQGSQIGDPSDRYPFLLEAASRINVRVRQDIGNIAKSVANWERRTPSKDDAELAAAFLSALPPGALVLEPLVGQGPALTVEVRRLLGIGGNALVYGIEERSTRRRLAMKVPLTGWSSFVVGKDEDSEKARGWVEQAARDAESITQLFPPGMSANDLLATKFVSIPVMPPMRIAGLPAAIWVKSPHVAANAVTVFNAAAVDLRVLGRYESLTAEMKENLTREMILGLAYIHSCGFSHNDVKLDNMLVGSTGQLAYADFDGSRRFITPDGKQAEIDCDSDGIGAWDYLSPEAAACVRRTGERLPLTPSLDSWALGVSLYRLWCHRPPFGLSSVRLSHLLTHLAFMRTAKIQLQFVGCTFRSPSLIVPLIEGFLTRSPSKRLSPLEAVRTSELFRT